MSQPLKRTRNSAIVWAFVVLMLPLIPWIIWGAQLEAYVEKLLAKTPQPSTVAVLTISVLALDIFLPIPSSAVATLAGRVLGPARATLCAWTGLSLGALAGYALIRVYGSRLIARMTSPADLQDAQQFASRLGPVSIILLRPAPLLAEATVLLTGLAKMPVSQFLVAVALGNLAATLPYTVFGHFVQDNAWLPWALAATAAAPLLLTWTFHHLISRGHHSP